MGKRFSQSGYITFYELDNLFLHVAREKQASRDKTSGLTGRCLFKPRAVSRFIHHRHAGKRRKSHPEAARPPGAYGQARAARTGRAGQDRARQGPSWAALRKRAPPGRRPRTARASPAPGREARPGIPRPRVAGGDHPLPAWLPEGRPCPPRQFPPRPPHPHPHPAIPARRGRPTWPRV